MALTSVIEPILQDMEKKQLSPLCLFDLSKAFDYVLHGQLLAKPEIGWDRSAMVQQLS